MALRSLAEPVVERDGADLLGFAALIEIYGGLALLHPRPFGRNFEIWRVGIQLADVNAAGNLDDAIGLIGLSRHGTGGNRRIGLW